MTHAAFQSPWWIVIRSSRRKKVPLNWFRPLRPFADVGRTDLCGPRGWRPASACASPLPTSGGLVKLIEVAFSKAAWFVGEVGAIGRRADVVMLVAQPRGSTGVCASLGRRRCGKPQPCCRSKSLVVSSAIRQSEALRAVTRKETRRRKRWDELAAEQTQQVELVKIHEQEAAPSGPSMSEIP